jgi:ribulose-5-phosphate 4-epimerase/fuculose-1-phosphate aldolase
VVDFNLQTYQGNLTESLREVAALHIAILRARSEANTVIHTHSHYLTAFSIAGRGLAVHSASLLGALRENETIPVTVWGPRYSPEPVVDALHAYPHVPAVLLANHGPFAWSSGCPLAVTRLLVSLEEAAHLTFIAEQLGGAKPLPKGAADRVRNNRRYA